jgi:hypothetical protein
MDSTVRVVIEQWYSTSMYVAKILKHRRDTEREYERNRSRQRRIRWKKNTQKRSVVTYAFAVAVSGCSDS